MSTRRKRPSPAVKPRAGATAHRPHSSRKGARHRTVLVAGAALLLGVGGTLGVTALADRPDDAESTAAAVQQANEQRDVEATRELTSIAREIAEDLEPALVGLATAIPEADSPGPLASAAEVDAWSGSVDDALAAFGDTSSAGTAVNVARSSLTAAVEQFQAVVSTYEAALAADGAQQQRLIEIAGQQRSTAVLTWSVAATQIDFINVEADLGHAHVVLPATPGSGDHLDGAPEGTD
ncbi:hypothetical protein [Georgenia sp. H159]|uniref:hypothetical protein n=1 Tax=Georgenia sp. H159 TaxID=3076115 RepID=UPI002D799376|nr:hypothetical protein [Georgenia sp. H159]